MKEFRVTLTHRPGELARLTQLVADAHIDLRSVAGFADGHTARICLVAEDVAGLRTALEQARMQFDEEEVVTTLLENEPGQLAELTQKLAEADVNLHSLYILAREGTLVELGMTVDNPKKAKKVVE
jgi:hypothetical protein